jgi:malic enzyme
MLQLIILLEIRPFLMLSISFKWFLQFEDFANHNAFELLAKYGTSHLVFNDDIQVWSSING